MPLFVNKYKNLISYTSIHSHIRTSGKVVSFSMERELHCNKMDENPASPEVEYWEMDCDPPEQENMSSLDSDCIEMLETDEARERWVKFFFKFYIFSWRLSIFL